MGLKRVPVRREAAAAMIAGYERFAVQAARRIVRLQEKRRKLRRELKAIDEELRTAKRQMREVMKAGTETAPLDGALPTAAGE